MSLVSESPVNSSSSDDFAAILDAELDSTSSEISPEYEEAEDDYDSDAQRTKRRKLGTLENVLEPQGLTSPRPLEQNLEASIEMEMCSHPGSYGGMCIVCGQMVNDETSVALGYIQKGFRLQNDEIARLRSIDLKKLLHQRKLYLVLDLDHTLLNSTRLIDLTSEEEYLKSQTDSLQDVLKGSLFKLDSMHMMTKLRPYVHTFLKEASNLFEMYIYTMGEKTYAQEMAKLLDPNKVYFNSRVISHSDSTQRYQKSLDVVLGQESAVLILDDTEMVWQKHKDNLILMERYHFFSSSYHQHGFNCKSLSELKSDESEPDGALSTVLKVLKRIHSMFFDPELGENFAGRDVREVLKTVRSDVLKGCKLVFSRVFPTKYPPENQPIWRMAEQLGAKCVTEVDPTVTHVVSTDVGTEKSKWAAQEKKFLVHPRWIEAANFLWQRQPEENFPVSQKKSN